MSGYRVESGVSVILRPDGTVFTAAYGGVAPADLERITAELNLLHDREQHQASLATQRLARISELTAKLEAAGKVGTFTRLDVDLVRVIQSFDAVTPDAAAALRSLADRIQAAL